MTKEKRRWRGAWLSAAIALVAASVWGAVPAQAVQAGAGHASQAETGNPKPGIVSDKAAYDQALKSKDWVQTPDGLVYKTCVYHAPNGATVANGYIVSSSGAKQRMTQCAHPTLVDPSAQATPSAIHGSQVVPQIAACSNITNTAWWSDSCWGSSTPIVYSYEEYAVPSDPTQDGALVFLWGGLEDGSGTTVLQGVLTWGANGGVTNPNIWYITPWYVAANHSPVAGSSVHVAVNDTIESVLSASNCTSAGLCTWNETVYDVNSGGEATLTVGSGVAFTAVFGGVMEVPRATGCVETPASGHGAFRDLSVENIGGGFPSPSFGVSTPFPECSIRETASPTGADILWSP